MNEMPEKKHVFMYGQWVEVQVLPPQPTPDVSSPVSISKAHLFAVDVTIFDTQVTRRGRRSRD